MLIGRAAILTFLPRYSYEISPGVETVMSRVTIAKNSPHRQLRSRCEGIPGGTEADGKGGYRRKIEERRRRTRLVSPDAVQHCEHRQQQAGDEND